MELSKTDYMISGLLGGIAEYYNLDSFILRAVFILIGLYAPISMLFLYAILSICVKNGQN